ncbi:MAG: asparagine synthase (glutamine-hydrolyzing), partial [Bacteroidia bacterium]
MCGIAGFIDSSKVLNESDITKMTRSIEHRGPDSSGQFFSLNEDYSIGLGHTRLSIIDTSTSGNQPMSYEEITIVFNGEIYNYREIKNELRSLGHIFQTESDTEVIIRSFIQWGSECVKHFHGMWAFALYDAKQKKLHLCRDRIGVKPLHYKIESNQITFCSEIKGIIRLLDSNPKIDKQALSTFFNFGYISQKECIYDGIYKVQSGEWLTIDASLGLTSENYWKAEKQFDSDYADNLNVMSHRSQLQHAKDVLIKAFNYRMVADVPVGLFLSGGVDSSLVCAILNKECGYNLNTFTVGFKEKKYDESAYATRVSNIFNTNHTEERLTLKRAKDILYDIPKYWDEPFGDASAIPTFLVSNLAAKNVKVSLSADGADELFLGYPRYSKALEKRINKITRISSVNQISKFLPFNSKVNRELLKTLRFHGSSNIIDTYDSLVSEYGNWDLSKSNLGILNTRNNPDYNNLSPEIVLSIHEIKNYLEGNILCKVDRASMSNSLESREPFLDQDVVRL